MLVLLTRKHINGTALGSILSVNIITLSTHQVRGFLRQFTHKFSENLSYDVGAVAGFLCHICVNPLNPIDQDHYTTKNQ